jgi:hypothetical protein
MSRWITALTVLAGVTFAAAGAVTVGAGAGHKAAAASGCSLTTGTGKVKHVVYLQFDNTHYRRDRPNVPSDLEQMPHLLDFLKNNGTLFANDHTVLISHTSNGILSSLTGLYPDRNGMTVGNSYGYFRSDGVPAFTTSFKYWTDPVDAALNPLPNMITFGKKATPAPWAPFTRAGCDVGGVGTANIELENTNTSPSGDMTKVFGANSPEWEEALATPAKAQTDFVGIAIHCGNAPTSLCASSASSAKADELPDEPGGYAGFKALFGTKYVNPAITKGNACVNSTAGQPITDPVGTCGFPGFDGMLAANTLGYAAQMLEAGVPVVYGYISDAHDYHVPNTTTDAFSSSAQGPGEANFKAQLKSYDDAFAAFFQRLQTDGITKANTLFVVTVDEGDHFAGGNGTPQADGTLAYTHSNCATLNACPGDQLGEVNANLPTLLPAGEPAFSVHSDSAPTFYVNGNPPRTDPAVRKLERDVAALSLPDPYVNNGQAVPAAVSLADPIEERALHMVNADPTRTPTFTLFGHPDFFFTAGANPTCGGNPCVAPGFAWNHGDVQEEIGNTWAAFVGPGVVSHGVDTKTWTDHTNLRPTILALVGLKDSYVHDGRVLVETLDPSAIPTALAGSRSALELAQLYEKLNAPFGQFATDTLAVSTEAIKSTDEAKYESLEGSIVKLTARRDFIAGKIKTGLQRATFSDKPINAALARKWLAQGEQLLKDAAALKTG